MTDAELNALVWKEWKEAGMTEQDVAEAASRPDEVKAAHRWAAERDQ
jgi:hypothetical protein